MQEEKENRFLRSLEQTISDVKITYKGMVEEKQYWLIPIVTAFTPLTVPVAFYDNFVNRRYENDNSSLSK